MYYQWKEIDWWQSHELGQIFAPENFYSKFPLARVIVDGTVCPIMQPSRNINNFKEQLVVYLNIHK